nr:bifunctional D-glycero-beta-D-manno-heptose-7-phosphate kinase/D-glycero-beta-D-manno-heptose 1-phosphate adenylyltransferase HldE [Gammaproteobacteria bacterium]
VLVAGDVMLDRYWYGATSRISPEAPVPVVHVQSSEARPGGAANVAVNVASLGAQPYLIGLTGDDDASLELSELLDAGAVEHWFARTPDLPTVTKMRVVSRHQQLLRLDFEDPAAAFTTPSILATFRQRLPQCDVVILSDYGKGSLNDVRTMVSLAHEAHRPVVVDPKGNSFERYRQATLITPNVAELEAVVGPCPDRRSLIEKGSALRESLELDGLLITRSEHGMLLLSAGAPVDLAARAQEVFDVTGAGDTVVAVLAAALGAGATLVEATELSNRAAGIVVSRLGTASVTAAELKAAAERESAPASRLGVLEEGEAEARVRAAQAAGERVVMTNGCFDLLHIGHITYLEQAKARGDRLLVAVNSDASVQALKGSGRPIVPLDQRMRMLAALESVDWVVDFAEDTPERLICKLLPDLLVKGGDYRIEDIAGGECVMAAGGDVEVLHFEPGISTSAIIERISDA